MKVDILTLFPELFASPFAASILGKAQDRELLKVVAHNLRDWAQGKHKVTDDSPYGGFMFTSTLNWQMDTIIPKVSVNICIYI